MTAEFAGATLLVTGGTGFVGQTVVPDLIARFPGRIVSVHRGPRRAPGLPAPHVEHRCDLNDGASWHRLLGAADYVLWMAALRDHGATPAEAHRQNVAPLRAALPALLASRRLRRLVFVSSISAVDQPWHPHRPRPMADGAAAWPSTPYGHSKLAAERLLLGSGLPCTVLRLPFLYGPGFRPGSFLDFYRRAGAHPLLRALRYTANLSLLFTGDVAGLVLRVLAAADATAAGASPYLVCDGPAYEVDELVSAVALLHGRPRPRHRLPVGAGASALALAARRLQRPDPVRRGRALLLATYWSHAAFTRDYFVVDASRFHAAFPGCTFTPVTDGLARAYRVPARAATPGCRR
jgi:UDP-glucose 4-epimerase